MSLHCPPPQTHKKIGVLIAFILCALITGLVCAAVSHRSHVDLHQHAYRALEPGAPSPLGDFPAETDAERELEGMLAGPDDKIDLSLANYLIVADLPQFGDLTRSEYFGMLGAWTEHVRKLMEQARKDPAMKDSIHDPKTLSYVFCSGIISLGIDYPEQFKKKELQAADLRAMYQNANNVFLPGLLRTRAGTCVSLPMLYLAVAEQLGFPLHLVGVGQHRFVRWEQGGFRMNVETTIVRQVAMTPSEDVFLETEGVSRGQLAGTNALRNLTRREVVGDLFFVRACHYESLGDQFLVLALRDNRRAVHLMPDNPRFQAHFDVIWRRYNALREAGRTPPGRRELQ